MPLESPDLNFYEAACGFLQLGMAVEADAELDKIDPFNRAAPEVLALRVEIYRKLKKWELMREIAKRLNEFQPNVVQWFLSYAFATRRVVSIEGAKQILLKSIAQSPRQAAILFKLACYECQLGQLDYAKDYLKKAFAIDPCWRKAALENQDLKPLWDELVERQ